jgi:hypothetical protein
MHVVGQFRDLADPDRFVWLRGFESMPARRQALAAFYGGPVWARHRDAANATMIDSDDVLLLQPVELGSLYPRAGHPRPPIDCHERPASRFQLVVCERGQPGEAGSGAAAAPWADVYRDVLAPALRSLDAATVACLRTLHEPNTFPALPVRDTDALVWLVRCADGGALAELRRRADSSPEWAQAQAALRSLAGVQVRLLQPSARSQLR